MFTTGRNRIETARGRAFRWIALAVGCVLAAFAAADVADVAPASTFGVVVKYRDSVVAPGVTALPGALTLEIGTAFRSPFAMIGRTRDGAFELAIDDMSIDEARAGLNRLRENPDVLYANFARPSPSEINRAIQKSGAALPPVRGLIVKYKDARVQASFSGGGSVAAQEIARISAIAQQPVVYQRTLGVGASLFLFMQRVPDTQAQEIADALQSDPAIEYADPDRLVFPMLIPNDPAWPSQWDLMIPSVEVGGANLPPAWDITTGSASINIAILDTGILPHPDLAGRYMGGLDFITDFVFANDGQPGQPALCLSTHPINPLMAPCIPDRDGDASDPGDWISSADDLGTTYDGWLAGCSGGFGATINSSFHGTHVAGEIGAATNNSIGVAGINWASKMIPLRVLGKCGGYTADINDAIIWAVNGAVPGLPANPNPAKVLNMSLGGHQACPASTQNAITTAIAAGATVVVAAGNSNDDAAGYSPAGCMGVITVAATQRQGLKAYYSNYGGSVEMAGPGGGLRAPPNQAIFDGILSTLNNGTTSPNPAGYNYVLYQGTSMATPHVVGVVSLMYSVNPAITPGQVLAKLQQTARAFPAGNACGVQDPKNSNTWFSCACTTATCGAGMLDAYRAVAATVGAATNTTLTLSPDPVLVGNVVNMTSTVSGIVPTGTITFKDGSTTLATVPIMTVGDVGTAQLSTSTLTVGGHLITATYSGDGNNKVSASLALTQNVWSASGLRKRDFNGDAKSDLLWAHTSGLHYEWLVNGASYSAVSIGVPGSTVAGLGDVSGEGRASIVYFNAATTQVFIWRMSGGSALGVYSLGAVGAGWSIKGIGDVNGDGFADIVWQHTNGTVVAWLMNWTGSQFTYTVRNYGVVGGGWSIAGVGDLDGDGVEDIVWFYAPTNAAYVWLLNAGGVKSVLGIGSVSSGWTIQKVADFDGDNKADIFWRNGASNAIWYMNGAAVAQVDLPPVVGATWSIVGAGDWDSDHKYDLMWREAGGIVYEWKMNGRGVAPTPLAVGFIDSTWSSVGQ